MEITFYTPNTVKNSQISENFSKFVETMKKNVEYSEFGKNLLLFEKGQLTKTSDSNTLQLFNTDNILVVPQMMGERDIPWNLYKESYKRIPLVYNAVNNSADFALQADFELDGSADATKKILLWMDEVNFELILLNIFKQMQIYGNAYLDISNIKFPKLLPPEQMYVVVKKGGDDDGKVVGYKQIISFDKRTDINFTPDELIHFKWNDAIHPFYGMSEIHPALGPITRYENWQLDLGQILHRYAAPIIQWRLGTEEFPATKDQISEFRGTVENRLPGEDILTSTAVEAVVVGAGQKMMQVDGLVKAIENQIIGALRIPEVFARGGESSNKATAAIELEAFDRKVKALQKSVSFMLEDFLFPKLTSGKVEIVWNEISAEGELQRAQRVQMYVTSGVTVDIALRMVGLGTWADDVKKAKEEQDKKDQETLMQQKQVLGQGKPTQTQKPQTKGE